MPICFEAEDVFVNPPEPEVGPRGLAINPLCGRDRNPVVNRDPEAPTRRRVPG
jgi:hypothetical protein